jgi:hypothetical protein
VAEWLRPFHWSADATVDGAAAEPAKQAHRPRRSTRNQEGRLWVKTRESGPSQGTLVVRPKADIVVEWEAPMAVMEAMGNPEVGLFRMGVATNQSSVIAKPATYFSPSALAKEDMDMEGLMVRSAVPFYAPRSAGTFVFRLYDADDNLVTHGTSPPVRVEVQGRDTEPNLRFVLQQFKERKTVVAALSQLSTMLRSLAPFSAGRHFHFLLWDALYAAMTQLDALPSDAKGDDNAAARQRAAVHAGVANVLQAALRNRVAQQVLDDSQKVALYKAWRLWCPFTEEFLPSEAALHEHYAKTWGMQPSAQHLGTIPMDVFNAITRDVEALVPSLLPSERFYQVREEVRGRLEGLLASLPDVVPPGTKLRVFGSSANNFGSDSADLDMCMAFPRGGPPTALSPPEIVERLAEQLEAAGMTDVVPRSTARIPILLFKDGVSGLDCDISLENPLAVRNTQLLMMYSRVDPRVRYLAYVVKHWARQRRINSPSEGTLSSYAYVLLVLQFLQTRRPPLVPNLQRVPPDWAGQDMADPGHMRSFFPPVLVQHPIEKMEVDTYFWTPSEGGDFRVLNQYAARNKTPVGALLVDFFRCAAGSAASGAGRRPHRRRGISKAWRNLMCLRAPSIVFVSISSGTTRGSSTTVTTW